METGTTLCEAKLIPVPMSLAMLRVEMRHFQEERGSNVALVCVHLEGFLALLRIVDQGEIDVDVRQDDSVGRCYVRLVA